MTQDTRWAAFNQAEQMIISAALGGYVRDVITQARTGALPNAACEPAAASLLVGAQLMLDVNDTLGFEVQPGVEVFHLTATMIKDGTFAAQFAAAVALAAGEAMADPSAGDLPVTISIGDVGL